MKKIPTLFKRDPEDMKRLLPELNVELPEGATPTAKWDGTAVRYDGERWWARREVKAGKTPPPDFAEADHDEVTGKRQGWVPITNDYQWRWHHAAIDHYIQESCVTGSPKSGTYEAVGLHFQGDPHGFGEDTLMPHGDEPLGVPLHDLTPFETFEFLRAVFAEMPEFEGFVWWHDGEPVAKLKRRDFGLPWPVSS